jgi:hypothetical protein
MFEEISPQIYLLALALLFLWLTGLSFFLARTIRHYRRLTTGVEKKNLQAVLEKVLTDLGEERQAREKIGKWVERLEKESFGHLQKIGLLRYNPFQETGGDQSFVLAILDGQNSGVVVSSLHGRNSTRVYAKPVKEGKAAGHELSKEEEEALRLSLGRTKKQE